MSTSIESRLWLALHLLYPNSSQAFDVYQGMLPQVNKAFEKDDRLLVFSKLASIFDKIPPISSNLSFYEFELENIDHWKTIYKNSQKNHLLVFVGVLIFDLKIIEISPFVNLPQEKLQFIFHQMFKKLVQNNLKTKYNESANSIKQNDYKISYLYTYENLIEFCLEQLPEAESKKVEIGLELYPALLIVKNEYLKIINQIQNLKVQRPHFVELNTKKKLRLVKNDGIETELEISSNEKQKLYKNKKVILSIASILLLSTFMLFQFTGIYKQLLGTDKAVIIQQVVNKQMLAKVDTEHEIAQESVPAEPEVESALETIESQTTEATEIKVQTPKPVDVKVVEPTKAAAPEKVALKVESKKAETLKAETKKVDLTEYKGGLYRGVLVVKDLKVDNEKMHTKLIELGAKKAGDVDLGWMKTKQMAYYHFIIPETNLEESNKYLRALGSLEIKFETHSRLIPTGTKRFIIEVKNE